MVERLAALPGRADEDLELLARPRLADVLAQQLRAQRAFQGFFLGRAGSGADDAFRGRGEVVGLDGHARNCPSKPADDRPETVRRTVYFTSDFSAARMPSLTPMSAGSALIAAAASLSL